MRRGWAVPVAWGTILAISTAAQLPYGPSAIELAMLGGAAAACLLTGLVLFALERARRGPQPVQDTALLPDLSAATVLVAIGVAVLLVGAEVGQWMMLMGGGAIAIGIGGLVREFRAERSS